MHLLNADFVSRLWYRAFLMLILEYEEPLDGREFDRNFPVYMVVYVLIITWNMYLIL